MPLGRKHLRRNRDAPNIDAHVGGVPRFGTLGLALKELLPILVEREGKSTYLKN